MEMSPEAVKAAKYRTTLGLCSALRAFELKMFIVPHLQ
jgi:hypothetical protein